jgi:hypothetical protein
MVRTSTIIVIVMCTCLIAGGGLGTYYFRSNDDAALKAEEIVAAAVAARELELAEERAAAVRANAPVIKTAAELAQEKLEIAKAEAGVSKFSTDIGKSQAETRLITAVRELEEAEARLQEVMSDNTTSEERRLEAQLDVDAAKIDVDAAAEVVRIQRQSQAEADEIARLSAEAILALEAQVAKALADGDTEAARIARESIAKITDDTAEANRIASGTNSQAAEFNRQAAEPYRIKPENQEMCSWKRVFVDGRIGIDVKCSN